ncbi:MAG: MBL fold metallo-hydrolase [Clostridium sp.]
MDVFKEVSGGKKPGYVVSSHYNCDHTWGNKVFEDSCIIMHKEADRERKSESIDFWSNIVKLDKNAEGISEGPKFLANELDGFDLTGIEWVYPDIEIESDINMRLGDTVVQILNVAPAHSDSDLLLWMPEEKVLFAGDIVFNGCAAYSEEGIRNWVSVLNRIINELKPEVVVPGHGAICGLDFVIEQRDYLLNLVEEFNKHYDDDIDAMELSKKIDVSQFLHWISPERAYASIDALLKGKRGICEPASWDVLPGKFVELRTHMDEKYSGKIQKWDPMSAWVE